MQEIEYNFGRFFHQLSMHIPLCSGFSDSLILFGQTSEALQSGTTFVLLNSQENGDKNIRR